MKFLRMHWLLAYALAAACLVAVVACERRAAIPSPIGATPVAEPLLRLLVIGVPPTLHLGDAPITPVARMQFADGSVGDVPPYVCRPEWSSSAPTVARVDAGVILPENVGDVVIRVDCGDKLRGEAVLGVRRKVVGIVFEQQGNVPTPCAQVRVVGTVVDGTSTLTDQNGRFALSVMDADPEVEVIASGLETQRQRIKAGSDDVLFRLEPALLTTEWSGTFQRSPGGGKEANGIPPNGVFEFETHHVGTMTLSVLAGCVTSGTYDDFGAVVQRNPDDGRIVLAAAAGGIFFPDPQSVVVSPGRYLLSVSRGNFYATVGCPWSLVLKRPH